MENRIRALVIEAAGRGGLPVLRGLAAALLAVLFVAGVKGTTAGAQENASGGRPEGEKSAPAQGEKLPPGVLARVNGRDITVREYADYLLSAIGTARLSEFIDRLLIEEAARKEGIEVRPEEVERLVEERIDRTIKGIYRGSREEYLKALEKQGVTEEERKARLRQRLYYELLLDRLILKHRKITEEDIQREFERLYGPGGVQYELRHILVSTGRRIGPDGSPLPARSEAEARERAEKILRELKEGADFVELVRRYSDDTFTRRNDGRIPVYREGFFGKEFHEAVLGLSEENPISGVVRSRRGFHIIQLVRKKVTRLEDVRDEIVELLKNRPPTAEERHEMIKKLRSEAEIVR